MKTFKEDSNILDRIKNFLPIIDKANQELMLNVEKGVDCNIEHLDEEKQHIEMDLNLGIFDVQKVSNDIQIPGNTKETPAFKETEFAATIKTEHDSDSDNEIKLPVELNDKSILKPRKKAKLLLEELN